MKNAILIAGALVLANFCLTQGTASAVTSVVGTNYSDQIWVGLVRVPTGATIVSKVTGESAPPGGTTANFACVDSGSSATWYYLGGAFAGIADDFKIWGYAGVDTMRVVRSNTNVSGDCSAMSGAWTGPTYPISGPPPYIDLIGGSDTDYLYGGDVDTNIWGGTGNDRIYSYAGGAVNHGEGGNDRLVGLSGGVQTYTGGNDSDCIDDNNMGFTAGSTGGSHSGTIRDSYGASGVCPSDVEWRWNDVTNCNYSTYTSTYTCCGGSC